MDVIALFESPQVQRVRERIRDLDDATLDTQIALARIAAPSGRETERAEVVREKFRLHRLTDVHCDAAGNVHGTLPGRRVEDAEAAPVLVTAHLDSVFPEDTDLTVRQENGRIQVPGIADNARGLAGLLTLVQVLCEFEVKVRSSVHFVATVGEEGAGDLRGVKQLFRPGSAYGASAAFISLDGSGMRRIVHRAVGSKRLRLHITCVGGHSWSDWGLANPLHALGAAISALRSIGVPSSPRTTLTVARVGGGTSINAIPEQAWLELDLRSESKDALSTLEHQVLTSVAAATEVENLARRAGTPPLETRWVVIGDRPGGETPMSAPLIQAAMEVTRALGVEPELASSSTDSNVPISLGVPAVTLGVGGESGGIHTTDEWYNNDGGSAGIERALLLTLAVAGFTEIS